MRLAHRHRAATRVAAQLALPLLLIGAMACGSDADSRRVASYDEPARTMRVLSLMPSVTETIVAMGAADRLVGRTDYDTDPRLAHLPSVGGSIDPSLERIARLHPDLVLARSDSERLSTLSTFEHLSARVEPLGTSTLGDLHVTIDRLGVLLNRRAVADSLWRSIRDTLESVRRSYTGMRRVRVFFLVWPQPLMTAGAGTFIDTLITIAGGENVFHDVQAPWPTISFESLLVRGPDVIVVPRRSGADSADPAWSLRDARWRSLAAVRRGRVVRIDADLLSHLGPRLGLAARTLATVIHAH